jgi:DNA-binding IclR family transcriptional regulator
VTRASHVAKVTLALSGSPDGLLRREIVERTKLSIWTVGRALAHLQKAGLVGVPMRGRYALSKEASS